jgi:hypothetical protein
MSDASKMPHKALAVLGGPSCEKRLIGILRRFASLSWARFRRQEAE